MVGILTFHWADDYGAMLQAYALKRQLERLGEEAELIPYAPFRLTGRYWLCPLCAELREGRFRYYIHWQLMKENLRSGRCFWVRRRNMRRFRRKYLTDRTPVRSAERLSLGRYKTVFVGSDQVWNPDITFGLDDAYLGSLPRREGCRLAAYGASLGGAALSEGDREKILTYIGGGFSALSMREESDAARLSQLLGRKVESVLDPVLLLDRGEWERIAVSPGEENYILLYLVEPNPPLMRAAQTLAAQTGQRLVSVVMRGRGYGAVLGGESRMECGPAEFVGYLQNASCVLTNSFHGTAFSIVMEKPFLSFRHGTRGVRQEDMLRRLGLDSHLVKSVHPSESWAIWRNTDWTEVRRRLTEERKRSTQFILDNL